MGPCACRQPAGRTGHLGRCGCSDARPGDRIHVIAEATDEGALPLTRYVRAVIVVR